eukprot:gene9582-1809_t
MSAGHDQECLIAAMKSFYNLCWAASFASASAPTRMFCPVLRVGCGEVAIAFLLCIVGVEGVRTRVVVLPDNTTATEYTYDVAVLNDRRGGNDADMIPTFSTYLNAAVSPQFDDLVKFDVIQLRTSELIEHGQEEEYDFAFMNPSIFTCAEIELDISPLLTIRRNVL